VAAFVASCGSSDKPTARPTDDPGPPMINVKLTDSGCVPENFTLRAGDVEFRVTNVGAEEVTEMEVQDSDGHVRGDVEGVEPGHTRSFVVALQVGTYRVRCPEEAPTGGTITVT
jgi:uncharacterized cupredoxin-like copper-binding protein